jgi:hypothetical protein
VRAERECRAGLRERVEEEKNDANLWSLDLETGERRSLRMKEKKKKRSDSVIRSEARLRRRKKEQKKKGSN